MSDVTQPTPARPSLGFYAVRVVALVGCLGGGLAAGTLFAPKSKEKVEEPVRAKVVEPLDERIDRHIRNGEFAEARALCQPDDELPAEPWLAYRLAVCLERLDRWRPAAAAYDAVAGKSSERLWANATLAVARCRLANGATDDADATLQQVEHLGGAVDEAVLDERTRLRACVEYTRLGVPRTADPFDPAALAWPPVVDRRDDRDIWLPPVPATPADPVPTKTVPIAVPPPAAHPAAPRERVRESLRKVLETQDHPAVRLTLANFDAQDGAWAAAVPVYRQLIEDAPDAAEAKLAAYNLGLGLLRAGATAAAREAFLGVVDRDPRGPWGELGRYWVGRAALDGGDPAAAVRPFRAATAGKTRRVRAAASFALTACYLLTGQDAAAEREGRSIRPEASDTSVGVGDLLDHVWRYRTTPSPLRAEQLADALRGAGDLRPLGPAGVYLSGRLLEEIGNSSEMAALFDAAAAEYRGPWVVRMTLAAGEHWDSGGNRAKARSRYLAVAAIEPAGLGRRAELNLARMAAREGNGKECLGRCLRLWKDGPADPDAVLLVMARGFELTGDYAAAAACFAGREPKFE
jgi:tetratricopeptide (TPR) repeat protein